jgi:PAS domain S-box-containing protein
METNDKESQSIKRSKTDLSLKKERSKIDDCSLRKGSELIIDTERSEKDLEAESLQKKSRNITDKSLLSERDFTDSAGEQESELLKEEKSSHDVTKNSLAESDHSLAISKAAEEKYRGLIESAQDAIIVVGKSGTIEFSNQQVTNWFGYSEQELVGQPVEILVPKRFSGIHVKQRDEYLENPTQRPMGRIGLDLKGRRKDGSEFPIDVALSPSVTSEGKFVTAIIRDITERKRHEVQDQFLAKASRILAESMIKETLIKAISLITSDIADGCVLLLIGDNGKLQERVISHKNPEKQQFLERLVRSVVTRGKWPMDSKKILFISETTSSILEEFCVGENEQSLIGHFGIKSYAAIPLQIQGEFRGILSLFHDESKKHFDKSYLPFFESVGAIVALSIENARLYEDAQRSIKVREEILSIVSHDLKNPITSISIISQLLLKIKENDFSKLTSYSGKIKRSADQMQRMIEDLMDFSKIQEGNLSVEKQLEKPITLVELVYEMMKGPALEKNLTFTTEVNPDLSELEFDKQRMAQALMNLVGNAIKFTEEGGQVKISAKEFPESVQFFISDSGPGIHSDDLLKVFDRYWQAQKSKTLSAGLGLSITKGIAEAHGGSVLVESQLGKGSTFIVSLPK